MIKSYRIRAFVLRHIYEIFATLDRKADIFLYPTIDLLIFGLLAAYIDKFDVKPGLVGALLGAVILWTLVYNVQRDINFSILEDAWSRNLFNLFSTPLQIWEVIIGVLILSIIKAAITIVILLLLANALFHFNLLALGGTIAFYIFNIFIFAWAFGFFTSSIIFRFGTKVQAMAWSLVLVIYPISGVFYPISTLPPLLENVAKFLPISYIFDGLRDVVVSQTLPLAKDFVIITFLNAIYLAVGLWLFIVGFKNAKKRGWFIHPA